MASLRVAEGKEIGFLSTSRLSCLMDAGHFIFANSDLFGQLDLDQRGLLVCLFGVDYDFISIPGKQDISSRPLIYIAGFPTKQKNYLEG